MHNREKTGKAFQVPLWNRPIKLKRLIICSVLLTCIIIFFSGCAPTIKTKTLVPAKYHEAAKLRRISILPFDGPMGNQVRADIESLLLTIRVNDEQYFSIMERTAIDKIFLEQNLQISGAVNETTAVEIGKLAGVQGIVMGTVTQSTIEENPYSVEKSKCISKNQDGSCKEWQQYWVNCRERNAYFSFTPKFIDVATGEIAASEVLSGHVNDETCLDSGRPLKSRHELLSEAKRYALEKLRKLVAPYDVDVEIKLLTEDDSKIPPEAKENINNGIKWVKAGRVDRACEFWNEAFHLHPYGYAIYYLLGVCSELSGDLNKALSYYEKADRNTGSPIDEIREAIDRVTVSIEKQKKLDEVLNE